MTNKIFVTLGAAVVAATALALPATTPCDRGPEANARFAERVAEKAARIAAGGSQVVFVGDSITHNWEKAPGRQQWLQYFAGEPYKALNLGYSGDTTENTLWRIEQGELDGYEAKCVVLMIGTNNGGRRGADETVIDTLAGLWRVIRAIQAKQPKARIVLHPIFPRGEKPDNPHRVHNDAVNRELAKLCDGRRLIWCDFTDQMLEADGTLPGELMPDYLHPRQVGYELWAAALKPIVDFCLTAKEADWYPNRYAARLAKGQFSNVRPYACMPTSMIGARHDWDPYENWWLDRVVQKQEEAWAMRDKDAFIDLVFIGDSITHNWEGARGPGQGLRQLTKLRERYTVLDLGFGGDDTRTALWRLRNGHLDHYKARCVQLLLGTNNGGVPAETVQGLRLVIGEIRKRQPQAKILLLAVFPCGAKPDDPNRRRVAEVNRLLRPLADGEHVIWVDFGARYLEPDGTISPTMMPDYLHPAACGYDIWVEEVEPHFRRILGR